MKFDHPQKAQISQLRSLWKEAFGDTEEFLDIFFSTAFSPNRCRCAAEDGQVLAVLYWFDVSCAEQKLAYIYAVATGKASRGRGLCRALMADTAEILRSAGYQGALLVPQSEGLYAMYGKMGYLPATALEEFHCAASEPLPVREIRPEEYAALRPALLPPDSVIQEGESLLFLEKIARFYKGDGFLAAVSREAEHLRILEYLGNSGGVASLVAALGHREATVRTSGGRQPFSMYLPLDDSCPRPAYFAFCFD